MPIYEYQCSSCTHCFDLMQKIGDAPVTICPECAQGTVVKLVSASGFQLKGNGWYATDFKSKPGTPAEAVSSESNNTPKQPVQDEVK